MLHHDLKPKYNGLMRIKKDNVKYIQADYVAQFYGVVMVRIWSNNTQIKNMWSVRELLNAVPSVKESMPKDSYKDLYWCMYFVDD